MAAEENTRVEETIAEELEEEIQKEQAMEADPEECAETEETESEAVETEEADEPEESEKKEEAAGDQEENGASEKEKKSFFKKKKEKKDPRDEQILDLTDKLKRSMAEFENFRKRTEKEKSQMYEIGASDVIAKILPVVDNFERGLDSVTEDQKDDPIASGMELIYKQLMTVLDQLGVKPIEAVGNQFDPNFHNAVMHVEDPELEENVVVEEFQKGYMYRDSVVRHSMVKVAN